MYCFEDFGCHAQILIMEPGGLRKHRHLGGFKRNYKGKWVTFSVGPYIGREGGRKRSFADKQQPVNGSGIF